MKSTILFIGGGYTTLFAYKQICNSSSLVKKIKKGELELIIICDRKHHYFHGFTGDVIGGAMPEQAVYTPLKTIVPFAQLIQGRVTVVSPYLNTLKYTTKTGLSKELKYDHLVIGAGTVDNEKTAKDFAHSTFSIKKPKGLYIFRKQLDSLLLTYKDQQTLPDRKEKEHIVLSGAGFTSIEIATNMHDYMAEKYGDLVHITIVNSGDQLLKEWQQQPRLIKYAEKMLDKKGIRVLHNCTITATTAEGVKLSDGSFLKTQLVVNATGQIPVVLQGLKHLCLNKENKIETTDYLNALGHNNIWCGGDIALVKKPFGKGKCPPNALWAIMQGERIGKNIRRRLAGKVSAKFHFPGLGQAAAFGKGQGALELFGLPVWGWPAYLIRFGFFFYFFPAKLRLIKLCWKSYTESKGWTSLTGSSKNKNFAPEYRTLIGQHLTKEQTILETA